MNADGVLSLNSESELRAFLWPRLRSDEERSYFELHALRYLRALEILRYCLDRTPPSSSPPAVCDVAPHWLSEIFAAGTNARVNTAGVRFLPPGDSHPRMGEHLDLDLNALHDPQTWLSYHRHDVVFLGEIVEHLHAAPSMVLGCISRWVKPGGFLVVQTPNAVSLSRRAAMLAGRHPYEMIHPGRNPGHIREYTSGELTAVARSLGFAPELAHFENYFRHPRRRGPRGWIFHMLTRWPRTLREGMTFVFRRSPDSRDDPLPSKRLFAHAEFLGPGEDGLLHGVGWAVDHESGCPAPRVELHCGGTPLAEAVPDRVRPDVAQAHGTPGFERSGFHLKAEPPADWEPSSLRIVVRDRFGDFLALDAPGPPRP